LNSEILTPNYDKLDIALRSVGYSFEAAVADIVDNSIDAGASNVGVRLVLNKDKPLDLVVWDDGSGMSPATLREAMRFGSDVNQELDRLGKFGLGLKLASLGQAKELRVITRKDKMLSGRAWLEQGIRKGFHCNIIDQTECADSMKSLAWDFDLDGSSGTLVWWSHLYRVGANHSDPEEHAQHLLNRLVNHLSMSFHRFLGGKCTVREKRSLRIFLDIYDRVTSTSGLTRKVQALDPFGYSRSGHDDFPAPMLLPDGFRDQVSMRAHIWPPNCDDDAYKLPGGVNSRQGFYFYRNDRLIQAGGWNGIRDADTHRSLARVEIDLAPGFDVEVSLDVKKMNVSLPSPLAAAFQKAKTSSGIDFKKYVGLAEDAYRTRTKSATEMPVIPDEGLPAEFRDYLKTEFRIKGAGRHRMIAFRWDDLPEDRLFEVDNEGDAILLNSAYRRQLLHGLQGSATDVPVFKCLLFLLFKDAFYCERIGARLRDSLDLANRVLLRAVKYERSCE
jgi:hypothetical protein